VPKVANQMLAEARSIVATLLNGILLKVFMPLISWFSSFDHRASHLISRPRPKSRFFSFLVG
jgi:hypothetical protein